MTEDSPRESDRGAARVRPRGAILRPAVWALAAALMAAIALGLVRGRHDTPSADEALIELRTINASAFSETSGPYSRFGWSHPGPLLFYAQAPFYTLGGRRPASLYAGAAAWNLIFIALALYASWQLGGASAVLGAAAVCLAAIRAHPVLASTWNPHLLLFPWLALIVCGGAWVVRGGPPLLLAVVFCGSWLVQTHVGAGPGVLLFVVTAVALRPARMFTRQAAAAVAVTLVLWAPVIADVARYGRQSNPWQVASWFAHDAQERLAFRSALKAAGESLTAFVRPQPVSVPVGWAWRASGRTAQSWAIACGVLLVTLLAARRAGTAAVLAASVFVGGIYTAWSVRGEMVDHLLFWLGGGLPALVVIAAGSAGGVPVRFRRAAGATLAAAFAACAVLAARGLVAAPPRTNAEVTLATNALLARAGGQLDHAVVDIDDACWGEAAGIVARLRSDRHGVRVPASLGFMYGRAATAADDRGLLRVIIRRDATAGSRRMTAARGAPQILAGELQIWLADQGRGPVR